MPPFVNLYPNSGKKAKRVDNPGAAGWKSLPKQRIFLILVEIPDAAVRESLPKQRKRSKRVDNPDNVKGKKDTEM